MDWPFGAVFLFLGVLHLVPSTRAAMEEGYRRKWGKEAAKVQTIIGIIFVIIGAGVVLGSQR